MNWIIFWIEFSWNNFELNKLLNWIFMIQLWIEYWIESILGKIQTLNWINLGIEQGYPVHIIGFKKLTFTWTVLCFHITGGPCVVNHPTLSCSQLFWRNFPWCTSGNCNLGSRCMDRQGHLAPPPQWGQVHRFVVAL